MARLVADPGQRARSARFAPVATFDDGSGPALYAGGVSPRAGGQVLKPRREMGRRELHGAGQRPERYGQCTRGLRRRRRRGVYAGSSGVARWTGSTWLPLGSGIVSVLALAAHDDGSGPALFAGGTSTQVRGGIARAGRRSILMAGPTPEVRALAVFDDGGVRALRGERKFTLAGGVVANNIARWDGAGWSALGSGTDDAIDALVVHDDGSASCALRRREVQRGGRCRGEPRGALNGTSWTALAGGVGGENASAQTALPLRRLRPRRRSCPLCRRPLRPADRALGRPSWAPIGIGMTRLGSALTVWDDGTGPALFAGGEFGGSPAGDSYLAKWACKPKATVTRRRL